MKDQEIKCSYPDKLSRGIKDMIQSLPTVKCGAEITLVDDAAAFDKAMEEIRGERILGFDTETRPSHRAGENHPVSILQLSSRKKAWVFRLSRFEDRLGEIFAVLENPEIKKVGVGMAGDIKGLGKLRQFKDAGFEHIEKLVDKMPLKYTGLRNLTAIFMGRRLSKSAQMSNWAAEELTRKQIEYAATDAWISLKLYEEIKRVLKGGKYDVAPERAPDKSPFSLRRFLRKCARKLALAFRFPGRNRGGSDTGQKRRRGNGTAQIRVKSTPPAEGVVGRRRRGGR